MTTPVLNLTVADQKIDVAVQMHVATVTAPSGTVLPKFACPVGQTEIDVVGLTEDGTYNFSIETLDTNMQPAAHGGVAYPPVTGTFDWATLVGSVVSGVTISFK